MKRGFIVVCCYLLLYGGGLTVLNRLSSERGYDPPTSELVLLHKCFLNCSKFYSSSILNLNYPDLFRRRRTVTSPWAVVLWISLETSRYQWMDGGDPEIADRSPGIPTLHEGTGVCWFGFESSYFYFLIQYLFILFWHSGPRWKFYELAY